MLTTFFMNSIAYAKFREYHSASLNFLTVGRYIFMVIFLIMLNNLSAQEQIPDSVVKMRIDVIQKSLDAGQHNAEIWWRGWLYGYCAATVAQGVVGLSSNRLGNRQDMFLGAGSTVMGVLGQLISPMTPAHVPEQIRLQPEDTPQERTAKLKKAEELFAASAKRDQYGHSWKNQAASGVVNLGCGLVTWLGFKRTIWEGAGIFALNTAICEVQIFTQPTRAIKDYKRYCNKYMMGSVSSLNKPEHNLSVSACEGGLALRFMF